MTTQSLNNRLANEGIDSIREQAAEWIVLLDTSENAEQHIRLKAECEHWQNDNPQRRHILNQMQQMYSAFDEDRGQHGHRQVLSILGTLILGVIILVQLPWDIWTADHHTAIAEIRDITLPDGSVVVLNNNTAINVDYTEQQRTVHLERGELMVTVKKDRRPFNVITTAGSATALGTIYQVTQQGDSSIITVQESSVRVSPRNTEQTITLTAGQRVHLTSTGIVEMQTVKPLVPDWISRNLVFNDVPLEEVIEQLERYRPGKLGMSKTLAERKLHFTGVLPIDDNDNALALLVDAFDLNLKQFTPYFVWVSERNKKN